MPTPSVASDAGSSTATGVKKREGALRSPWIRIKSGTSPRDSKDELNWDWFNEPLSWIIIHVIQRAASSTLLNFAYITARVVYSARARARAFTPFCLTSRS